MGVLRTNAASDTAQEPSPVSATASGDEDKLWCAETHASHATNGSPRARVANMTIPRIRGRNTNTRSSWSTAGALAARETGSRSALHRVARAARGEGAIRGRIAAIFVRVHNATPDVVDTQARRHEMHQRAVRRWKMLVGSQQRRSPAVLTPDEYDSDMFASDSESLHDENDFSNPNPWAPSSVLAGPGTNTQLPVSELALRAELSRYIRALGAETAPKNPPPNVQRLLSLSSTKPDPAAMLLSHISGVQQGLSERVSAAVAAINRSQTAVDTTKLNRLKSLLRESVAPPASQVESQLRGLVESVSLMRPTNWSANLRRIPQLVSTSSINVPSITQLSSFLPMDSFPQPASVMGAIRGLMGEPTRSQQQDEWLPTPQDSETGLPSPIDDVIVTVNEHRTDEDNTILETVHAEQEEVGNDASEESEDVAESLGDIGNPNGLRDDSLFLSHLHSYFVSSDRFNGRQKRSHNPQYVRPIKAEYDTVGINKVFAAYWIDADRVLFGTKCDKLICLNVHTGVRHQISKISDRLVDPSSFHAYMTGNNISNTNSGSNGNNKYFESLSKLRDEHSRNGWLLNTSTRTMSDDESKLDVNNSVVFNGETTNQDEREPPRFSSTIVEDRSNRSPIAVGYRVPRNLSDFKPSHITPLFLRRWTGRESPLRTSRFEDDSSANCSDNEETQIPTQPDSTIYPGRPLGPSPALDESRESSTASSGNGPAIGGIYDIAANPSKTLIAVSTGDPSEYVRIYSLRSLCPIAVLHGPTDIVFGITWITDDTIVSAQRDGRTSVWKLPQIVLDELHESNVDIYQTFVDNIDADIEDGNMGDYADTDDDSGSGWNSNRHPRRSRLRRSNNAMRQLNSSNSREGSRILKNFRCLDGSKIYVLESVMQSKKESHLIPRCDPSLRSHFPILPLYTANSTRLRAITRHGALKNGSLVSTLGVNGVVCTWDIKGDILEPVWKGKIPEGMDDACAMCSIDTSRSDSVGIMAIGTLSHICIMDTRLSSSNVDCSTMRIPVRKSSFGTRCIIQCSESSDFSSLSTAGVSNGVLAIGSGSGKVSFLDLRVGRYLDVMGDTSSVHMMNSVTPTFTGTTVDMTDEVESIAGSEYTVQSSSQLSMASSVAASFQYASQQTNLSILDDTMQSYRPGWLDDDANSNFQQRFIGMKVDLAVFSLAWRPLANGPSSFNMMDSRFVSKVYGPGIKVGNHSFARTNDGCLFIGGGPIQLGLKGSYAALW